MGMRFFHNTSVNNITIYANANHCSDKNRSFQIEYKIPPSFNFWKKILKPF